MAIRISVIMPIRNSAECLQGALDSIAAQDWSNLEVVVIDGASTDNTRNVIERNSDLVDVFLSEPDSGWADAFNKGLALMTGDYAIMLAADDRFLPGAFDKFAKSVHDDAELWCGSILEEAAGGYLVSKSNSDFSELRYSCSLRNPATFYKASIFEKYGYFSTQYRCSNDREFFLRCYKRNCIIQVADIPITLFSAGGMSTTDPLLAYKEGRAIAIAYNSPRLMVEMRHILLCMKAIGKRAGARCFPRLELTTLSQSGRVYSENELRDSGIQLP